ncbi:MAG: hypothetical protein V2I82_14445 [Halieaceae bacterium]|nr:hypothetical protein [Halieaceae bacterium]
MQQLMAEARRWQLSAALDQRSLDGGEQIDQWDRSLSTALRYGITPQVEVNATYRRGSSELRVPGIGGEVFEDASRRSSLELGANWLARGEDEWPALLLAARVVSLAEQAGERARFPSFTVGATTYRSIDPVVLSLRVAYTQRAAFTRGGERLDGGGSWQLEPLVNFAVNPRVTLIGGFTLGRNSDPRVNGQRRITRRYPMALRVGLGFAPTARSTVFLSGDLAGSGRSSGLSLRWFQQF